MTKIPLAFAVAAALCLCSCRSRIETVPPLTAPLDQTELSALPDSVLLFLPVQGVLYTLCENGSLIEIPSGRKRLDLAQTVRTAIPVDGDRLLIQTDSQTVEIGFSGEEVSLRRLPLPGNALLTAACPGGLLYNLQDRLFWLSKDDQKPLDTGISAKEFLALREHPGRGIDLLSSRAVLNRAPGKKDFESKEWTTPLAGPASFSDRYLWVMTKDRRLRKYHSDDFTLVWEKKMDHQLQYPVVESGDLSLAVTRSSSMTAIRTNGTQVWYVSFGALPLTPPLILGERILVPVRFREQVLLKVYDRRGGLLAEHPLKGLPQPPFLLEKEGLVFCGKNENRELKLFRVSTLHQVSGSIRPKSRLPKGELVPIELTVVNLIKPEHRLSIIDRGGTVVWSARISSTDSQAPVWKPELAGDYVLRIETDSRGLRTLVRETPFSVYDREQLIRSALDRFLRNCFLDPERQE